VPEDFLVTSPSSTRCDHAHAPGFLGQQLAFAEVLALAEGAGADKKYAISAHRAFKAGNGSWAGAWDEVADGENGWYLTSMKSP
jgi:hypothetical protein